MAAPTVPSSLMLVTVLFTISDYCSTRDLTHPGDYTFAASLQYGSPQEFSWTSNYSIPLDLVLVQETAFLDDNTLAPQLETIASDLTHTTTCSWDGKPSQNLSLSKLFWLAMYQTSDGKGPLFKSQYFNVTSSASSSSTTTSSSSSSPSSTTSTLTAHPTTTPTSTTPPASPTPSNTPKSTNNHVALAAGLGAGLGGTALILAVALFYFLGRKRHNKDGKRGRREVYQLAENDTFSH